MKLSCISFYTYSSVCSSTMISPKPSFLVDNIDEIRCSDTYYSSQPIKAFEEDLYCKLLRHQYDFIPRINLCCEVAIWRIQVIHNSLSTLFRRSRRYVEEISKHVSLLEKNKRRKHSFAFIHISNLAKE